MRTSAAPRVLIAVFGSTLLACGSPSGPPPKPPAAASSAPTAAAPDPHDLVEVELLADVTRVGASQELRLGTRLAIAEGWRVFWTNPGERGTATELSLRGPEGFAVEAPRFPGPERFDAGEGLVEYGYRGDVLIPARVIAPDDLDGAPLAFSAEVSFVACRETCIPDRREVSLKLEPAAPDAPSQPVNQALFATAEARVPGVLGDDASIEWRDAGVQQTLVVTFAGADRVVYFPAAGEALVGQAVVPTDAGSTLHLSYEGEAEPAGVIAVTRGELTSYYRPPAR